MASPPISRKEKIRIGPRRLDAVKTPGGGGMGPPRSVPPRKSVERDIARGLLHG